MPLPSHRLLPAPLRLAAGVVFLATVLPVASCGDAIEAYCTTGCPDPAAPVADERNYCVILLEGAEHLAEHVSCDDAFQAYFRCQQAGPGGCGFATYCPDEVNALYACVAENDPDNVCNRGFERLAACVPGFGRQTISSIDCTPRMCPLFCYAGATCEEISDLYSQGQTPDNGLTRCIAACAFAQTDGTIGWLEDD